MYVLWVVWSCPVVKNSMFQQSCASRCLEVCGINMNWWSRKQCTIITLFFYLLLLFKDSWFMAFKNASLRRNKGVLFPNMPLLFLPYLLKCCQHVFLLFCGLCCCNMGSFWAETEWCASAKLQAEYLLTKLCPANFTGCFNKASGTDRTVKLATVTAIYKLWIEHCSDYIDFETYHQGWYSLTFLLAVCHRSSIYVKSEIY